jgi:hypothetical protein
VSARVSRRRSPARQALQLARGSSAINIDELLRSAIETVSQRIADLLDGKRTTVLDPK